MKAKIKDSLKISFNSYKDKWFDNIDHIVDEILLIRNPSEPSDEVIEQIASREYNMPKEKTKSILFEKAAFKHGMRYFRDNYQQPQKVDLRSELEKYTKFLYTEMNYTNQTDYNAAIQVDIYLSQLQPKEDEVRKCGKPNCTVCGENI